MLDAEPWPRNVERRQAKDVTGDGVLGEQAVWIAMSRYGDRRMGRAVEAFSAAASKTAKNRQAWLSSQTAKFRKRQAAGWVRVLGCGD